MSIQDFKISYTFSVNTDAVATPVYLIQSPAGQLVITVPTIMESAANQFSPIISSKTQSSANQLAFTVPTDMQGPANQFDAIEICAAFNVLSAPGQSTMSGPPAMTASCP